MKGDNLKLLLTGIVLFPMVLFASSEDVETDIVQRLFNFVIFAGILWYLLADKIKVFFANRTLDIQAKLDKVEDTLKESKNKVDEANRQLSESKVLASEIVENAKNDIDSIAKKVNDAVVIEIANLNKSFDEGNTVQISREKKKVISSVLDELLNAENLSLSQEELVNIVLKKVA